LANYSLFSGTAVSKSGLNLRILNEGLKIKTESINMLPQSRDGIAKNEKCLPAAR
jgi:hypothetical protein